jgi:molybdopterin/thiamine biosynthesis adenylyltransferase
MDIQFLLDKLKEYNVFSSEQYNKQAFSRNIGLFTQQEQEKLAQARIAIPGMGGVGGVHLMTMVRTGIGRFHLSDFDVYEPANINRQFGARVPDFGRSKMEVMKEQALSVNPYLEIKEFPDGISQDNVDAFLEGVDVVLDSLDFFAFDARRLLFNRAREKGVHVITAGPLGFSSAMLIFAPDKGMGFDEYFNIVKGMKPEDQYLAFALGLAPRATQFKYMDTSKVSFKSRKGPSLNIACQLCSAMAGTEAVRILLNRGGIKPVPYYFQFDPYAQRYCKNKLYLGNRHPWQRIKTKVVKRMLDKNAGIKPEEPEMPIVEAMNGGDGVAPEIMKYIIMAGIQAPSGDNAQPWKFAYDRNEVILTLNRDTDHSFFNVNQMASVISCGAVIENMKLVASKFGLKTDITYSPDTEDKIAVLRFTKKDGFKKDELADFIWKRQTNRKLFKAAPVIPGIIDEVKSAIKDIEGTDIHFITSPDKIKDMAKLVSQVDRIRIERKDLHEHLFSMIRFSMDETLEKRDGFYLKNLEAGFDGELFLKATKKWPVMNVANKLGMGRIVAQAAYKGIVNSSGVGLVTTKGLTRDDYLNGGRALERAWLALTKAGYQFQPMAAVSLFFLRKQLEGDKSFSNAHTRMLNKVWLQYKRILSIPDIESKAQVMLFRFGQADNIQFGTLRKKYSLPFHAGK